jgi:DNA-binding NtrC family response regulator
LRLAKWEKQSAQKGSYEVLDPLMDQECASCGELWRQHEQAAGALEEADARLKAAGSAQDHGSVQRLLAEVRAAARVRAEIELRIESHEQAAHYDGSAPAATGPVLPLGDRRLCDVERTHIERIVAETGRNLAKAARILDIDRSTLYSKLKKYGLK